MENMIKLLVSIYTANVIFVPNVDYGELLVNYVHIVNLKILISYIKN